MGRVNKNSEEINGLIKSIHTTINDTKFLNEVRLLVEKYDLDIKKS